MNKKRVVITGGSGLLALNWACAVRDHWDVVLGTHLHKVKLEGVSIYNLDLDNLEKLKIQFDDISPDLVVHTAGLSNVDRCEESPDDALYANAVLARNVAQVAAVAGIKLVHISTDHLFSGSKSLYPENSIPEPLNEYARSKLIAEEWVHGDYPESLIVRTNFFGWGYSTRQSFSDWIIYNLRSNVKLSLFDDVYFTPILVDSLALAAHKLVEKNAIGVYNVVGDERVSKYEFAQKLILHFDLPNDLIVRNSVESARLVAQRPHDMSLSNIKVQKILDENLGTLGDYFSALHLQELDGRRDELFNAVS